MPRRTAGVEHWGQGLGSSHFELPPPLEEGRPEADDVVRLAVLLPADAEADEGALTGLVVVVVAADDDDDDDEPEADDGAAAAEGVVVSRGPVDGAAAEDAAADVAVAAPGSTAGMASGTSGCFPDSGVVERLQARP
ncbi:uncharacterized protein PpBr36_06517 [Pyricularia pennisetigena]|uniref:uncharacterized protein n=1 Tax=Pyricularia pennisetigena TaxID=1578925 RepID=UPI00114F0D93|nr:uncharacterized protein PpBr36_06517 [Pyricularia pennisetigena]TLS23430.1 hypothetical protein PpBr36_06517 [Pyricularia pennisetigena]